MTGYLRVRTTIMMLAASNPTALKRFACTEAVCCFLVLGILTIAASMMALEHWDASSAANLGRRD